jgi:hypothetical protein
MHREIDLERVRTRVAELATLAEAPELIDGLEALIARVTDVSRGGRARASAVKKRSTRRARAAQPRHPSKKKRSR